MTATRKPPAVATATVEIEQQLLGLCLTGAALGTLPGLEPAVWIYPTHAAAWAAIKRLRGAGEGSPTVIQVAQAIMPPGGDERALRDLQRYLDTDRKSVV